ncbi:GNAT family N-acetyltransferase [Chitinolyticbacter meiyuanensis]|uniref:GNAT family N-acetyltransferase n=1 Tax=Chitinolyticbacter meiyuanensis TaxID=682798 RepID=UPI0011E604F9|nr:GNAT family N-acetyltransferase [Chitinolyticbacter meiyuanensis]
MRVLPLTDDAGRLIAPDWLGRAEPVHRQLRPQLPVDYPGRMAEVCANGGRLIAAVDGDTVVGLALWRLIENTYEGRRLYVDDLIVDQAQRSLGVGQLLLGWLETQAGSLDCAVLALDSGVQRSGAHKFYFREGMTIASYSFRKALQ